MQNIGYPRELNFAESPVISSGNAITSVQSKCIPRIVSLATTLIRTVVIQVVQFWGWCPGVSFPRVVGDISASPKTLGQTKRGDNEAGEGPALSALIGWAHIKFS